jgi:hypothetical protein
LARARSTRVDQAWWSSRRWTVGWPKGLRGTPGLSRRLVTETISTIGRLGAPFPRTIAVAAVPHPGAGLQVSSMLRGDAGSETDLETISTLSPATLPRRFPVC